MSSFYWPPQGSGGAGTVTSVTATSPLFSSGGTTPNLTIQLANGSQNGYLSSTDWTTFNSKQAALTIGNLTDVGTDGIVITGGTSSIIGSGVSIAQHVADTTHNGYLSSTDWNTFNNKQASLTIGNLTDAGTDGITVTGGTGSVIGSGTSISQHVADTTHNGYLSSADWNTFNSKQAAGNYITALTGDVTASGPGSVAATLATVNSNVGSFGSSTAIPSFTVSGKGLITAASSNAVIAPAGTLTGTTLASNVVTSSLTSLGTQAQDLNMGNNSLINVKQLAIGQTSAVAGSSIDIVNSTGSTQRLIQTGYGGTVGTRGRYANGTSGSPSAAVSTNILHFISGMGYGATGFASASTGALNFTAEATFTDSSMPTSASILTTPTGSVTAVTALKVQPTGQLSLPAFYTANGVLITDTSGNITSVAPGTSGNVLSSNGTQWVSSASPFSGGAFFASSQVTTNSGAAANTSFTTATNSPAFTITPTVTGTYKVYAAVPLQDTNSAGGVNAVTKIFNTSGGATLLYESQASTYGFSSAVVASVTAFSYYTLTAGVTYVFDIQTQIASGNVFVRGDFSPFYMFCEGVVTGTGALALANFGSSPNAQGASISASTLTLQPASSSQPGGVSTTTQTFAGSKTLGGSASDKTTIGTASSTAIHQFNGGMNITTRTITNNLTIDTSTADFMVFCNNPSSITVTLPAPSNGRRIKIKDINGNSMTNTITIAQHASETIEGINASYVFQTNYGTISLISDGTNWWIDG